MSAIPFEEKTPGSQRFVRDRAISELRLYSIAFGRGLWDLSDGVVATVCSLPPLRHRPLDDTR